MTLFIAYTFYFLKGYKLHTSSHYFTGNSWLNARNGMGKDQNAQNEILDFEEDDKTA